MQVMGGAVPPPPQRWSPGPRAGEHSPGCSKAQGTANAQAVLPLSPKM